MKTPMEELIDEIIKNSVAGEMFWIKQPNELFEKYLEKEKSYYQSFHKSQEEIDRWNLMNDIGEGKFIR